MIKNTIINIVFKSEFFDSTSKFEKIWRFFYGLKRKLHKLPEGVQSRMIHIDLLIIYDKVTESYSICTKLQ